VGLRDALERLSLAEKSTRAGASTEIDLARTRQDTELVRAQVVSADESVRQAREALGLALGHDGPVGVRPDFQLDALAARVPGPCRALAELGERTDLLAAKAREQLAHRGELDARAQFLPTIGVRSTAQVFAIAGQAFPIWNLQAVLTVPLWDGGGRYGVLREAGAAAEQSHAQREGAERVARTDVARAQRGIEVASQAQGLANKALEQAQRVDALTRRAYEAGLGTSLELVTAASSLRQQQLNLALRDYDVLRARVVALFALAECAP
jgi:outer membrane protein TolC